MKHEHFTDIQAQPVLGEARSVRKRILIGPGDGAENFYMRSFEIAPGGHTPLHQHEWEHEVFVHAGAGRLNLGGSSEPVQAGDVVFLPGGRQHQFENTGHETLQLICLVPSSTDA